MVFKRSGAQRVGGDELDQAQPEVISAPWNFTGGLKENGVPALCVRVSTAESPATAKALVLVLQPRKPTAVSSPISSAGLSSRYTPTMI